MYKSKWEIVVSVLVLLDHCRILMHKDSRNEIRRAILSTRLKQLTQISPW